MSDSAIAVMLKAPHPGEVKTRLCPPLTHLEAAELYRRFIIDTFGNISPLGGVDIYAAYSPDGALPEISPYLPTGAGAFAQKGDGLGRRLYNAFSELFSRGCKRAVIIGSDSPDIPVDYIEDGFRHLDDGARLVLGPAMDGGYYLIGLDSLTEVPFTGIPWSTDEVLKRTIDNAGRAQMKYRLLPRWHDIDTPEDLQLLKDNPGCPRSAEFLASLKLPRIF